jgi:peroxiredoxin
MRKNILAIAALLLSIQAMAQSGLKEGMMAPAIKATDNMGHNVDLKELLKTHKAVVVFFYRGQWCPYCNKHIQELQDSLQMLEAKGAYVVGITPETSENIEKTVMKTHASFSIIQDKGYKIMKDYDVLYTEDAKLLTMDKYKMMLEQNNGNKDHTLPVPATYLVDKSGKISFVHFDKDYKNRAPVKALLEKL